MPSLFILPTEPFVQVKQAVPILGGRGVAAVSYDILLYFCDYAAICRPSAPIFCSMDIYTMQFVNSKIFNRKSVFIYVKLDEKKGPLFPLSRCQ